MLVEKVYSNISTITANWARETARCLISPLLIMRDVLKTVARLPKLEARSTFCMSNMSPNISLARLDNARTFFHRQGLHKVRCKDVVKGIKGSCVNVEVQLSVHELCGDAPM